ncbi:UDP-N-acetylglucosamine 2-epimerase (non-hydrolyzing) [Metabacillus sp. KIGAM252]|uniref:UDP-N-acetylglucosamine 2-epimerase (non-hydrolyzing) n=1 Tax=Metabacillus flavus TaxID=2823519 RepID=A0ABS5LBD0_9BACI|nr:UDP-N-acetylglucosamine 2-epimerase (non-hydrolyzing) [Metabacillus flavus]MBS2967898.1 UDP-N-acetylglucosamine 2-epimerase (non-hydrolyzing) [Metabacillus flavus]
MIVFGTRPEAIKMAPLVHVLRRNSKIDLSVCLTAQHREMVDQVLREFQIVPDYDLNIMKEKQTLSGLSVRLLTGMDELFQKTKPDMVLVHGDTTTTFIASLAAFYQQIPVGHVEAGLRTRNKYSPFPEELNRQFTGIISDLHFAPTAKAADNLKQENKLESSIFITGNTVIDAVKMTIRKNYSHPAEALMEGKKRILLTVHRRENLDKLDEIFSAIRDLADQFQDIAFMYPVHMNPGIKNKANRLLSGHERIILTDPLPAFDFHNLMAKSHLVLTDSGGIQEEAPSFGVPVVVLRDTTERPEGLEAGTIVLAGTERSSIHQTVSDLMTDPDLYSKMSNASNPYGDGRASEKITQIILDYFGISS